MTPDLPLLNCSRAQHGAIATPTHEAISASRLHSTGEDSPLASTVEDPDTIEELLAPHDLLGAGALGHAMLCDGPEHPDRRIPYRLATPPDDLAEVEPIGWVP